MAARDVVGRSGGRASRALALARTFPGGAVSALVYTALVLGILGPVTLHPRTMYAGDPNDPEQYIWYLGWFWHAVGAGLNPLVIRGAMNAPQGLNTMWNTSILAESFLFGPVVHLVNGVFAYNLLFALNLLLTFLLGEMIFRAMGVRRWLALLGGVLTGLLPYTTAQEAAHISIVILPPLLAVVLLLVKASRGPLRHPVGMGVLLGLAVAVQFYTSLEVLTTAAMLAITALGIAWLVNRQETWRWLRGLPLPMLLTSLGVATALALPGLWEFLFGPYRPRGVLQQENVFVIDLLNPLLPSRLYLFHTQASADAVQQFTGNIKENDGYLGLPALLLGGWAFWQLRHRKVFRALFWTVLWFLVLSLGPFLHVFGNRTEIPLPWNLYQRIPLIDSVLPARLMLYVDVGLVIAMVWALEDTLATGGRSRLPSLGVFLVALSWLPAMPYPHTVPPTAGRVFASCNTLCQDLRGQPTYIFSAGFPQVMAALGQSGYSFPVANVYGHNANNPQRARELHALTNLLFSRSMTTSGYRQVLLTVLPRLHVSRLLFFPIDPGGRGGAALASPYRNAIDAVLGKPIAQQAGAILWRVPRSLGG